MNFCVGRRPDGPQTPLNFQGFFRPQLNLKILTINCRLTDSDITFETLIFVTFD
jgi:hypothetical protein